LKYHASREITCHWLRREILLSCNGLNASLSLQF
jgi:hypothetical protein